MKAKTDLKPIFNQERGFFCVYGESATGKTTLMKVSCIERLKRDKKVFFMDVEDSFSIERFKQLAGGDYERLLNNILVSKIKNFKDQQIRINNLKKIIRVEKISLVIIDTITYYYRTLFRSKPDLARAMLTNQLKTLKEISQKTPVIVTSQVYGDIESGNVKAIAGNKIKNNSDMIIRLEKEPRKMVIEKPERKSFYFRISGEGFVFD